MESAANHGTGAEGGVQGRAASGGAKGSPAPGIRAAADRTCTGLQGGSRNGTAAACGGRSLPASQHSHGRTGDGSAELASAAACDADGGSGGQ